MTFDAFMAWYKKQGGTQKGFGLDIGISEAQMSRIVNRKQRIGLKMLNRIVGASKAKISMGELCKEFRPDIWESIMGGNDVQ